MLSSMEAKQLFHLRREWLEGAFLFLRLCFGQTTRSDVDRLRVR